MAITKVAAIRTSISKTLNYCISKSEMLGGVNCNPEFAKDQFFKTKERFNKLKGRYGYHAIQSFLPGEVTAELAHEIGLRLAEDMWGEKFEIVVATHTDKNHIHNHFIINSVSFIDGKKLRFPNPMNKEMAIISDKICKEYGLSVIDQEKIIDQENTYLHYGDWLDENTSRLSIRDRIKLDIDSLISAVKDIPDLINELEILGYEIRLNGKHPALKPPYSERFIRFRSLGADYSLEKLFLDFHKLKKESTARSSNRPRRLKSAWFLHLKILKDPPGSFVNLLKHYQIFLKNYLAKPLIYPTAEARKSAKRILNYQKEIGYLKEKGIGSIEDLKVLRKERNNELTRLEKDRNKLYLTKKDQLPEEKIDKLNTLNYEIKSLRSELKLIKQIIVDAENCNVELNREKETEFIEKRYIEELKSDKKLEKQNNIEREKNE